MTTTDIKPFTLQTTFTKTNFKIRVNIKFDGKRLSITGDEYEKNTYGRWRDVGGGQCYDQLIADFPHNKQAMRLVQIWKRWHLNDMKAGCEHQRALGWTSYDKHPSEPCPTCGYKYGTAWLFEAVPDEILKELQG